jgi:hypothetical protein
VGTVSVGFAITGPETKMNYHHAPVRGTLEAGRAAIFRTDEITTAVSKYQPLGGKTLEGWLLYTVYDQDENSS